MNEKAKLLFTSSRPLSWVNTAFPFAAGLFFFTSVIDWKLLVGTVFFLIPYNLLMYGVNDVYDYESDLKNPRKGGIEGAVVPKKYHRFLLVWSYGLSLPFVIFLLVTNSISSGMILIACLFFVVAYSAKGLRFKEIPVLDSVTSSLHFVGPLLYALSLIGWPSEALPAVLAFFFWGIASQSLGAIQDIIPDREAHIRSIATILGARKTVLFSLANYLLSSILIASMGLYGVLVAVAGLMYSINIIPYLHVNDETSEVVRGAWKRFLWMNYLFGAVVTITLIAAIYL